MMTRHWLWWHRHDAGRTEVLVMFDGAPDFDVVSVTDATGTEQGLSDAEADALQQHVEAHYDGKLKSHAAPANRQPPPTNVRAHDARR